MALRRQLFADGLYSFALRIANMFLAAALGILSARVLGPHGRGIYAIPMVNAGLATAGFAGLTSAIAFYLLRGAAGRSILRPTFLCAAAYFALGSIAVVLIAYGVHAPWAALPAILSLPAAIGMMIGSGYVSGVRRVRLITNFATMNLIAAIALMLLAFLAFGRVPSSAIFSWVLSGDLLGCAIIAWVIWDARKLPAGAAVPFGQYMWYSLRAGGVSLVSLLNYRADIYIVAVLADVKLLGMYTVAVTAAETLLTATQVTAMVASPHIGSMPRAESAQLVARAVRHNVLIAGICSAALAVVAPYAVRFLYGAAFLPVVPALRILLVGVFALSLSSPMSTFFTLRMGKPEIPMLLAGFSATICIVVTWLLVPRIGLPGAALGSTIAYLVTQAVAISYFIFTSGINARTILLPRPSDLSVYVHMLAEFGRRRGTIDSTG